MCRKEICDRILAKGRKAASSINADLVKLGRRSDKIRSSFGIASDWQDETSELYGDLVSKFAKQGTVSDVYTNKKRFKFKSLQGILKDG
jgi:hypothetical protein